MSSVHDVPGTCLHHLVNFSLRVFRGLEVYVLLKPWCLPAFFTGLIPPCIHISLLKICRDIGNATNKCHRSLQESKQTPFSPRDDALRPFSSFVGRVRISIMCSILVGDILVPESRRVHVQDVDLRYRSTGGCASEVDCLSPRLYM